MTLSLQTHPRPSYGPMLCTCALIASALVLAMFGLYLTTGVGQDPLQYIHTEAEYLRILLRAPPILKLAIGLDNAFVVFYSSVFLALGATLSRVPESRVLGLVSMSLLGLSGLLDLIENMHFLSMLQAAEQGLTPSLSEIGLQVWESLLKFHVSYLALFLFGFTLSRQRPAERALRFLLHWVQLPVGLLIYLTPRAVAVPLVMVRFSFFLVALLLLAWLYRPRASGSSAPA